MNKKKLNIRADKLIAHQFENPFVIPTSSNEIESSFVGGVYRLEGQIINSSKIKTIPTWTDKSPEFLHDVEIKKKYKGKSIYLGLSTQMFGHFFTDSSARLWYLLDNQDYDRLVFVDPFLDVLKIENERNEFIKLLMEILNIPEEKILIVRDFSSFENLIIPEKTIEDEYDIHIRHLDIFNLLKKYCVEKHKDIFNKPIDKIYIKNSDTNRSSLQCKNETGMITMLNDLGYITIDPQQTPISEQIAAIAHAKLLLSLAGANIYNIVFANDETTLVSIGNIKFKGRNFGSNRAFNKLKKAQYYHIKYLGLTYTSDACKIDLDNLKDQLALVKRPIRYVKLDNFSKTDYYQALEMLNNLQGEGYQYFEIGTNTGNSIKLAREYCVGVDPRFELEQDVADNKKEIRFYQIPSDDFFSDYLDKAYGDKKIDLAFIDGLHHADQVFKDIINTEAIAKKSSIITVHDIIPIDDNSAKRSRGPNLGAWTGDVWKAIYVLLTERKDLKLIFLDCPPSGLLLIFNPDNNWKNNNEQLYSEMTERADKLSDDKLLEYLKMIKLVDTEYFLKNFNLESGYEGIKEKRQLILE